MISGLGEERSTAGGLNSWFWEHAGSEHPGGAHLAYADGSVHFVSENLDPLILMAQASRPGAKLSPVIRLLALRMPSKRCSHPRAVIQLEGDGDLGESSMVVG